MIPGTTGHQADGGQKQQATGTDPERIQGNADGAEQQRAGKEQNHAHQKGRNAGTADDRCFLGCWQAPGQRQEHGHYEKRRQQEQEANGAADVSREKRFNHSVSSGCHRKPASIACYAALRRKEVNVWISSTTTGRVDSVKSIVLPDRFRRRRTGRRTPPRAPRSRQSPVHVHHPPAGRPASG